MPNREPYQSYSTCRQITCNYLQRTVVISHGTFLLITKVKYAKHLTENPYPFFILGTLEQRAAEIQCYNHVEFLQVMLFVKALTIRQL